MKKFKWDFTADIAVPPITNLTLEDPHLHKEYMEDKLSIMDVRATLGTSELVNIEIQIANKHDIQKRSCITGRNYMRLKCKKACRIVSYRKGLRLMY